MYDIVIVGAGPAGMTAAIYARRAGKTVLMLEAKAPGGQIVRSPKIENYPAAPHISGIEFAEKLYSQTAELGAEIRYERAIGVSKTETGFTVRTQQNSYEAKTVILATGYENRKLGIPDEDRLTGRGVSYCATCDGAFFRGKQVAVVGGGDTALEDALYLADLAETVYLIHRRDTFRGLESDAEKLREKANVKMLLNSTVTALHGEKRLEGITVRAMDGSETEIAVSGLFVAVGTVPENQNFASVADLDEAGYAIAGEDCKTKTPGIFVAGDNRKKPLRQLVTAAADGAAAATAALMFLKQS